jgi:uncharacterized membrane protein YfcA
MSTKTKMIVGLLLFVVAMAALYFYFKDDKSSEVSTTNQTKTGLGALNLTGLLGGLFGGTKEVNADNIGREDDIKPRAA